MNGFFRKHRRSKLMVAILSLSLLTVMAGAAVAPALDLIAAHFRGTDPVLVQMIISIPALFIFLTNMFFQKLCRRFRAKTLVLAGLLLYVVFGSIAGIFSNIWLILLCRALVGVGVGILMPMSTGLIAFYFTKDKQDVLMGYASAMNMMGGVVAMLIVGGLLTISWRASFLVYLLGLGSMLLVWKWMPNEYIGDRSRGGMACNGDPAETSRPSAFREYYPFIVGMFLLMTVFFVYPADFALETAEDGIIHRHFIAFIMAAMDILGFFGGMMYVHVRKIVRGGTKLVAPILFLVGYAFLEFFPGWCGTVGGSMLVGFANGVGVPFIMTTASALAGKEAPTRVMPRLSMALYLAQFLAPFLIAICKAGTAMAGMDMSSYGVAMGIAVLLVLWSTVTIKD